MKCPSCEKPLRQQPSPVGCPTHHDWAERAAIREFEGRQPRGLAELEALAEVRKELTW